MKTDTVSSPERLRELVLYDGLSFAAVTMIEQMLRDGWTGILQRYECPVLMETGPRSGMILVPPSNMPLHREIEVRKRLWQTFSEPPCNPSFRENPITPVIFFVPVESREH